MDHFPPSSLGSGTFLHASDEDFLLDFLRHASVILLSVGEDGYLRYGNQAFHRVLGYPPTELASGLSLLQLLAPELRDDWKALFAEALNGQALREVDGVFLTRQGRRIAVRGELDRVTLPDGSSFVRALFRDVTAEREAVVRRGAMEERFRAVAEVLLEGIAVLDSQGVLEYLNKSAEDILQVKSEDVCGYGVLELEWETAYVDGTPVAREDHPVLMAIRTGQPQPEVVLGMTIPHVDRRKWVAVSARPLVSLEDGRVYGSVASFRDVTAQLEAESALRATERRFVTLASQVPVGIFHAAPNGDCLFVNDTYLRLSGLSAEQAMGEGWQTVLHPDDRSRIYEAWAAAEVARTPFKEEYRLVRPDGTSIWVMGAARALYDEDDELIGFLGSVTDISHRRKGERLKEEMIALVSHELRGPLSTVRGGLRYLGEFVSRLPPEAVRYYEIAQRNTEYLVRLTHDLLDIEKLESGHIRLNTATVSVNTIFSRAEELNRIDSDLAGVGLSFETSDLVVRADADRLLQVMSNLISNGLKFSQPGSTVWITAEERDGMALISVRDKGRGIPSDFLDSVFERFIQVERDDSGRKGGAGLGLAICRALIQQMGGSIWAESSPGVGSRFSFTLPQV